MSESFSQSKMELWSVVTDVDSLTDRKQNRGLLTQLV